MTIGTQTESRSSAGRSQLLSPSWIEIPASAGIGVGRQVGCTGSAFDLVTDLAPGAIALVHQAVGPELVDGRLVEGEADGLADGLAVPVKADRSQIGELGLLVLHAGPLAVEVLHTHEEGPAGRAR